MTSPLRWYFRQPRDMRFVIRVGLLAAVLAVAGIGVSVWEIVNQHP